MSSAFSCRASAASSSRPERFAAAHRQGQGRPAGRQRADADDPNGGAAGRAGEAGFAIGLWGEQVAFIIDSASFLVSAAAILTMTVPRTTLGRQTAGGQVGAVWAEMREGVTYLFGNRTMVGILVCMAVVQLGLGAINVLWVPYLQRTFGVDATGLGIVDSAQGAGMVLGGLALGFVASRLNRTAMAGWALIVIGLFLAGMGLAPAFGWVIVLSFAVGLALVPGQSALMTMMQLAVPRPETGRWAAP